MLVIISAFDHAWWAGAVSVTGIVLAAVYILWMYQRTMTGPEPVVQVEGVADLDRREIGAITPLLVGLLLLGFYPMPVLDVINPYVEDTLAHVGVADDEATVPAGTVAEGGHE
jgi:NADH-quinone oxidoreductase subunit M